VATSYLYLAPDEAQFLATAFPAYAKTNGTNFPVPALAYDAASDEAAFWRFVLPDYVSGNLTLTIYWYSDISSAGSVVWEAQLSAITANTDTQDIETDGLATLNFVQDAHLGTTGQRVHSCDITLSNLDSLAALDLCHLRIARDANGTNATDDLVGDALLLGVLITYTS
jgi:hypothetical protein